MAKNHENRKRLLNRSCFSKKGSRANMLLFSTLDAA
jgi:hypothetical protein